MPKKKNKNYFNKKFFTTITPFSRTLALILFILFPILGFYLGVSFQKSKVAVDYIPISSCIGVRNSKDIVINIADNNKTFDAVLGDVITVNLPKNFTWDLTNGPDEILLQKSQNTYLANKKGVAVIQAFGNPACQKGMLCSDLAVNLQFTVNVK